MFDIIYLDMDGVIADLVTHLANWHGIEKPVPWPKGEYDLNKVFNIQNLWDLPTHFWATVPLTKDFYTIMEMVKDYHTIICTSHSDGRSVTGKVYWMQTHLPSFHYVIIKNKSLLAKPGTLLIDDSDVQVCAFKNEGGNAILYPRAWNSAWSITKPLKKVQRHFKSYIKE